MKLLALVLLISASFTAQAQLHRCIDERGRTQYTDKPIPGCKPVAGTASPAQAAKAAAKSPKKPPPMTREEREQAFADCKVLREQLDWLRSPRGSQIDHHAERVGQVEQAMSAKCS